MLAKKALPIVIAASLAILLSPFEALANRFKRSAIKSTTYIDKDGLAGTTWYKVGLPKGTTSATYEVRNLESHRTVASSQHELRNPDKSYKLEHAIAIHDPGARAQPYMGLATERGDRLHVVATFKKRDGTTGTIERDFTAGDIEIGTRVVHRLAKRLP